MATEAQQLLLADAGAWRAWLDRHHDVEEGVWLTLARKGRPGPTTITYDEALEEALCHGWIDGQARGGDGTTYMQRFTPRRARSPWSRRNVGLVARLASEGRMHPAGLAEVDRAKADGRWEAAYDGAASIQVPDDLAEALAGNAAARAMFDVLNSQNRYAVLYRLAQAKRADTRARRLTTFVDMLARGETIYPQRRRPPRGG